MKHLLWLIPIMALLGSSIAFIMYGDQNKSWTRDPLLTLENQEPAQPEATEVAAVPSETNAPASDAVAAIPVPQVDSSLTSMDGTSQGASDAGSAKQPVARVRVKPLSPGLRTQSETMAVSANLENDSSPVLVQTEYMEVDPESPLYHRPPDTILSSYGTVRQNYFYDQPNSTLFDPAQSLYLAPGWWYTTNLGLVNIGWYGPARPFPRTVAGVRIIRRPSNFAAVRRTINVRRIRLQYVGCRVPWIWVRRPVRPWLHVPTPTPRNPIVMHAVSRSFYRPRASIAGPSLSPERRAIPLLRAVGPAVQRRQRLWRQDRRFVQRVPQVFPALRRQQPRMLLNRRAFVPQRATHAVRVRRGR